MPSLLGMSGIGKRFGATQALDEVSFALSAGRVMALNMESEGELPRLGLRG